MITIPLAFLRRKTATTLCVDANLSDDQRWMADPASGNGKLRHFDLCRPGGTYFPPTEIDRLVVSTRQCSALWAGLFSGWPAITGGAHQIKRARKPWQGVARPFLRAIRGLSHQLHHEPWPPTNPPGRRWRPTRPAACLRPRRFIAG